MKALFIEGRRNGYNPAQCGNTMTVADLMAYLEQFDEDTQVYLKNDNGYTYGSIDDYSFEEQDDDGKETETTKMRLVDAYFFGLSQVVKTN